MALSLYTRPQDDKLIEELKIKTLREKTSISDVTMKLLRMWLNGEIKLDNKKGAAK
jgi:hypothetical protein